MKIPFLSQIEQDYPQKLLSWENVTPAVLAIATMKKKKSEELNGLRQ